MCFSCVPEAKVILKCYSSPWAHMAARRHNIKCSECGIGVGVVHEVGKDFEYMLKIAGVGFGIYEAGPG